MALSADSPYFVAVDTDALLVETHTDSLSAASESDTDSFEGCLSLRNFRRKLKRFDWNRGYVGPLVGLIFLLGGIIVILYALFVRNSHALMCHGVFLHPLPEGLVDTQRKLGQEVFAQTSQGFTGDDSRCTVDDWSDFDQSAIIKNPACPRNPPPLTDAPTRKNGKVTASKIPHVLFQTHENWKDVSEDKYLSGAVDRARQLAAREGWSYKFFSAEDRLRFMREDAVIGNAGLILDHDFPDRESEKTVYRELFNDSKSDTLSSKQKKKNVEKQTLRLKTRLTLDLQSARKKAFKTISLASIYEMLTDNPAVSKADFFRYCYVLAHGGVYMDTKSGFVNATESGLVGGTSIEDAIFGRRDEETHRRPREDMPMLYAYWGIKHDKQILPDPLETPENAGRELVMWFIAAQPRHRYLFRAVEQVARNIYLLNRSLFLLGEQSLVVDTGRNITFEDRGMKVLLVSGPVAYTNAILLEQRKENLEDLEALRKFKVESIEDEGIRFLAVTDPVNSKIFKNGSEWGKIKGKKQTYTTGNSPLVRGIDVEEL